MKDLEQSMLDAEDALLEALRTSIDDLPLKVKETFYEY